MTRFAGMPDDGDAMLLADAVALIRRQLSPVRDNETVNLHQVRGRVLADDLVTTIDLPPHDTSAMDGFAVRSADIATGKTTSLRLVGDAAAGHPFDGAVGEKEAVRILTGAAVPQGADRVVELERSVIIGGSVHAQADVLAANNIRRRGEDVASGTRVFRAGHRLRAQDVALAGALGQSTLRVRKPLRIGLFSTGDELCEPGTQPGPGQIWDFNRLILPGLLEPFGCLVNDYGILRDDKQSVEAALLSAARDCDLLITTGGMSVGREDHIRSVIGRRGSLDIWPISIRPGRPVGLGDIDDCPILALPGNPIAAVIAFVAFGRTVVSVLSGAHDEMPTPLRLPAGFEFKKPAGLRQYLLADLANASGSMSTAVPWPKQSPAMLSPLLKANGLIVLDEHREHVAFGDLIDVMPLEAFLH
jgi:molybdopterin molybdotransferase